MAKENSQIKEQLDKMKREALVESMIATGKLKTDLKEWANGLTIEQLEKFNEHAPKVKTILDEKNHEAPETEAGQKFKKWLDDQSRSRIIS